MVRFSIWFYFNNWRRLSWWSFTGWGSWWARWWRIHRVVRLSNWRGSSLSFAWRWLVVYIVACRLGRCCGSLIICSAVVEVDCIIAVCGAIEEVDCDGWICGAGTFIVFGMFGMRTRRARESFEWTDETQLELSVILLCLILLPPSIFYLASPACLVTISSVVLTVGACGRLSA